MTSKFTTAMIIMTVAALCAALAFQYMEMETFGLPATLKERFFSDEVSQVAPVDKLSVVLATLIAVVFLGEHVSAVGIGGVVMITIGIIMVALG